MRTSIHALARAYEAGGAAALSVLTERFFQGLQEDLAAHVRRVAAGVGKDFILDEYQCMKPFAWARTPCC